MTTPSGEAEAPRIEWRCDACDRAFPVDPDVDRVPCPYCGDINRIRRPSSEMPLTGPATNSPPETSASADHGEQVLRVVRPALVRGHPLASTGAIGLVTTGTVTSVLGLTGGGPEWLRWPGLVVIVVGLVWCLWLFVLGHRWDRLRITNHRVIDERGIVVRNSSEVLHKHVRNIRISQSFWQRIVGIGDIEIDSAAGDGEADIRIANVPDPDGVKRLVDRHRGF